MWNEFHIVQMKTAAIQAAVQFAPADYNCCISACADCTLLIIAIAQYFFQYLACTGSISHLLIGLGQIKLGSDFLPTFVLRFCSIRRVGGSGFIQIQSDLIKTHVTYRCGWFRLALRREIQRECQGVIHHRSGRCGSSESGHLGVRRGHVEHQVVHVQRCRFILPGRVSLRAYPDWFRLYQNPSENFEQRFPTLTPT